MSEKYTLVHEGLDRWINSPNNGGECCQTWADTVDELNRLLARIKRLEEAGDKAILNSYLPDRIAVWNKAKEAKP